MTDPITAIPPSASATPAPTSTTGASGDPFLAALQSKLMGQSDMISSDNSNIETAINKAISGTQTAGDLSHQATALDYQGQEKAVADKGAQTTTQVSEASRGYAVNTGLLQNITKTTNDQINALDLKKQEALASGDATTASAIAGLQLQGLQFQQQAQQQVFSNLLSVGNFMVNSANSARADAAQTFQEKNAISQVALNYGLTVKPDDTIDTITQRAQPFASQQQSLQLDQMRAAINASNATAQKAISDANANKDLSPTDIDALAQAYTKNPAVMSLVKNPTVAAQVIQKSADYQYLGYKDDATVSQQNNVTKAAAQAAVTADTTLSSTDKLQKLKAINEVYGNAAPVSNGFDLNSILGSLGLGLPLSKPAPKH